MKYRFTRKEIIKIMDDNGYPIEEVEVWMYATKPTTSDHLLDCKCGDCMTEKAKKDPTCYCGQFPFPHLTSYCADKLKGCPCDCHDSSTERQLGVVKYCSKCIEKHDTKPFPIEPISYSQNNIVYEKLNEIITYLSKQK